MPLAFSFQRKLYLFEFVVEHYSLECDHFECYGIISSQLYNTFCRKKSNLFQIMNWNWLNLCQIAFYIPYERNGLIQASRNSTLDAYNFSIAHILFTQFSTIFVENITG